MCAEYFRRFRTSLSRHSLPERQGRVRIVPCHGHKDESEMIRLALLCAAVRHEDAVLRAEPVGCHPYLFRLGGVLFERLIEGHPSKLSYHSLAHALLAVLRHRVCDFVPENNRQPRVIFCDREDAGVDDHLPAGHAPRVDFLALNEIELPPVTAQITGKIVLPEILFYGVLDVLAHLYHKLCLFVGGRYDLVRLEKRGILRGAHREHFLARDKAQLASSRNGNLGARRNGDCDDRPPNNHPISGRCAYPAHSSVYMMPREIISFTCVLGLTLTSLISWTLRLVAMYSFTLAAIMPSNRTTIRSNVLKGANSSSREVRSMFSAKVQFTSVTD